MLVAHRRRLSYRQASGLVDAGEVRHPATFENSSHGRPGDAQVVADAVWVPPVQEPEIDDVASGAGVQPVRVRVWSAGPVGERLSSARVSSSRRSWIELRCYSPA